MTLLARRPAGHPRTLATPLLALAACALGAAPLSAQHDSAAIAGQVDDWYERAQRSAPGRWGIAIADQSGRVLWGLNPHEQMIPASTVKLFTTGYARSVLGGDARRSTRVVGSGLLNPATGEWSGNWALELNGDFTLERAAGEGPTLYDLALQLASAGVRRLNGPLHVESADGPADAIYPGVWSPRHRGRLFAPLVGSLMIHENVAWLTVRPGRRVGHRAQLVGASPNGMSSLVSVSAVTRKGRRTRLALRPRKGGGWVVTGTIGIRAGARRFSATMTNPGAVLTASWAAALKRAGISWNQKAAAPATPGETRILAEVTSTVLDSLASEVNRRSFNAGAELLLHWAAGREQGGARLTQHVREVTRLPNGVHLVDGSGLSYDDRATPASFVAYLTRFPLTPAGRDFPLLLPANGSGTLRRLGTGPLEAGVVRAKTGTLGSVATVVGYLGRPNGVLIVSLMYNGSRPSAARQKQWELFRALGADGVVIPSDTFEPLRVQLGSNGGEQPAWWPTPQQAPADSTVDLEDESEPASAADEPEAPDAPEPATGGQDGR